MALLASVGRAAAASQVASGARILAGAGIYVAQQCFQESQVLRTALQHTTVAFRASRPVDSSELSLGEAVEYELERKKHLLDLPEEFHAVPSRSGDCAEDAYQRPNVHMQIWEQEQALRGHMQQPWSLQSSQQRTARSNRTSRSMHAASGGASTQGSDRLLKFLPSKLRHADDEEDASSSSNLTLMEALRLQRDKMGIKESDSCSASVPSLSGHACSHSF